MAFIFGTFAFGGTDGGPPPPPVLPGAINDLTVFGTTENSAQLAFTDALRATSHEYRLDAGAWQALASDKIVTGLSPASTYSVVVRGVNAEGNGPASNPAEIATAIPLLTISGTPVLTATEGDPYAGFTASASGGVPPYTYSLVGTWPAGLSVNSGTGAVSGTPTESGSFAGVSVQVTDTTATTASLTPFALEVAASGTAPVLTGPLEIADPSGEAIYQSDRAARHYWMLSANGTTPSAVDIAAGTGAISGAFGYFDAGAGSVQINIDFPGGIDVTGAVVSIAARVEPDGTFSNILRDTDVDVQTLPLSTEYLSIQLTAAPNFGALSAGWYLAIVMQRNGTMTSITPPGQAAVTVPAIDVVPTVASGNKPMRAYFVELTAARTGAWAIGQTGGSSYGTALYKLSAAPQLVANASDFANNAAKSYAFNLDVNAGDILFGVMNGHSDPLLPYSGEVVEDAETIVTGSHVVRTAHGTAPATGLQDVFNNSTANFTSTSAMAFALRRAS